jgi:Holliday junction resolvasome RuvABC endonuclease subunit
MKLLSKLDERPICQRLMGIDASTKTVAFTILDAGRLVTWGKFKIDDAHPWRWLNKAGTEAYAIFSIYKPEFVAIESAAYVNNRQTVIKLAYTYGAILSHLPGVPMCEVAATTWQSHIGNPSANKAMKLAVAKEFPDKSETWVKNEIRKRRKIKTQELVAEAFGRKTDDDDVADSAGVAWWAWDVATRRN